MDFGLNEKNSSAEKLQQISNILGPIIIFIINGVYWIYLISKKLPPFIEDKKVSIQTDVSTIDLGPKIKLFLMNWLVDIYKELLIE